MAPASHASAYTSWPSTSSSFCAQISTHCLARNPRAMTERPGHAVNMLDPRSGSPETDGSTDSICRRAASLSRFGASSRPLVMYGWRLLHDAPLAPVARLHAVVLWTAVHEVWLNLSRRG